MTEQTCEFIEFEGKRRPLISEPLNAYLFLQTTIQLVAPNTACWRGYYGTWKIENNKLYLTGLKAYIENYKEVGMDYLFPNQNKVFAEWYTGNLLISKTRDYSYYRYDPNYQTNFHKLTIENGCVV